MKSASRTASAGVDLLQPGDPRLREVGVVTDHVEAEGQRPFDHPPADPADAEQRQPTAADAVDGPVRDRPAAVGTTFAPVTTCRPTPASSPSRGRRPRRGSSRGRSSPACPARSPWRRRCCRCRSRNGRRSCSRWRPPPRGSAPSAERSRPSARRRRRPARPATPRRWCRRGRPRRPEARASDARSPGRRRRGRLRGPSSPSD